MTRPRICRVHDPDDVVPGRICGHHLPCREHTPGAKSGTATRYAEERSRSGHPPLTVTLPLDVRASLERIAPAWGGKSQAVAEAIRRLARVQR